MIKILAVLHCIVCCAAAHGQLSDREIQDLKTGRVRVDTSFVYRLPFETGKRYLVVQGSNSSFSHKHELALDFKMKKGSPVCAARQGKVIGARSDSDQGGLKKEFMSEGNYVIIQHEDGSTAYYWHLAKDEVMVNTGDLVLPGQLIGRSGNTGYTAFPHLHFQLMDRNGKQILPRFQTQRGTVYLRPGRWYKAS